MTNKGIDILLSLNHDTPMQEMWRPDALAGSHGMVIIVTDYVVIPHFHMTR